MFAVVNFLAGNVLAHLVNLRKTHGKRAVAVLPGEIFHFRKNFVEPTGSVGFYIAQDIGDGAVWAYFANK